MKITRLGKGIELSAGLRKANAVIVIDEVLQDSPEIIII